jgi:2-polyprenyl-3-methyl-5-hydroxy-6-metoxy-1,4-benzoquinol methylase
MTALNQPTISEQKRFWNWHWEHWQDRKTINEWKDKRHEAVLRAVRSVAANRLRILDVGCGPGWYTSKLAAFGEVTGIDLSEEAINMARSRYPDIQFIAGNVYDYSLPSGHFDIAISQEVIDHVEDSSTFVERVAEVLKPGGHLVLSCTNRFVVDRLNEDEFPSQPAAHIGRYFNRKTLKQLLRRNFQLLTVETIIPIGHRGILRIVNSYKLTRLLAHVASTQFLDRLKERAGLGYQIVVLAQKRT